MTLFLQAFLAFYFIVGAVLMALMLLAGLLAYYRNRPEDSARFTLLVISLAGMFLLAWPFTWGFFYSEEKVFGKCIERSRSHRLGGQA